MELVLVQLEACSDLEQLLVTKAELAMSLVDEARLTNSTPVVSDTVKKPLNKANG